jgi:hypothetical protein
MGSEQRPALWQSEAAITHSLHRSRRHGSCNFPWDLIPQIIELAKEIDPQMPLAEIRDAWTEFNRSHRCPRIGNSKTSPNRG